ncbi:hypothetical protein HOLleu_12795 [Holothuria leucospilota]|uniref:C2H2-type domain-containing protein n=1 Tax=Holothuria leucospilota TaxID=206669 RepID=A0A9Q1CBV1_HOLLE|nr:hypothetical protein HOLleu_12795 [Holothuria leucospilota]
MDIVTIKVEPEDFQWDEKSNGRINSSARHATILENGGAETVKKEDASDSSQVVGSCVITKGESVSPKFVDGSQIIFKKEEERDPSLETGMENITIQVNVQVEEEELLEEEKENEIAVATRNEDSDLLEEGFGLPPLQLDGDHKQLVLNYPMPLAETSSESTFPSASSSKFIAKGDDCVPLNKFPKKVKLAINERQRKSDNRPSSRRSGTGNKFVTSDLENQHHCLENPVSKSEGGRTCTLGKSCQCEWCEKRFILKSNCDKSEVIYSGVKHFKCQFCEKSFQTKRQNKRHEAMHTSKKPFQCQHCAKPFQTKWECKRHEKIHTDDTLQVPVL